MGDWPHTTIETVEGCDHFLAGAVGRIASRAVEWLDHATVTHRPRSTVRSILQRHLGGAERREIPDQGLRCERVFV